MAIVTLILKEKKITNQQCENNNEKILHICPSMAKM